MRKIIAIVIACCFLLGNIGLVPVKQNHGSYIVFQGLESFVTWVKNSLDTIAFSSVQQDADEDTGDCQDEAELFQLVEGVKPRSLLVLQSVPFLYFLSYFYTWAHRLGDLSDQTPVQGFLPSHSFSHLRFQAFLQIFCI